MAWEDKFVRRNQLMFKQRRQKALNLRNNTDLFISLEGEQQLVALPKDAAEIRIGDPLFIGGSTYLISNTPTIKLGLHSFSYLPNAAQVEHRRIVSGSPDSFGRSGSIETIGAVWVAAHGLQDSLTIYAAATADIRQGDILRYSGGHSFTVLGSRSISGLSQVSLERL